jgi:predicted transcriptional regulator
MPDREHVAKIVTAYVRKNQIAVADLPALIGSVKVG